MVAHGRRLAALRERWRVGRRATDPHEARRSAADRLLANTGRGSSAAPEG